MIPNLDPTKISVAENILEIATSLNQIHKVVRHYYLLGKKTNSYMLLFQLQMIMPMVLQEADALVNAVDTFKLGQPVGDGIGPVIAPRYMANLPKQVVGKDTVMTVGEYKGRTLYVLKAEGPMGYVGEPGVAIQKLVEEMKVPLNAIIMVDAALKLEGEKTGEIAEGVGAAIGGIGVDKFRSKKSRPLTRSRSTRSSSSRASWRRSRSCGRTSPRPATRCTPSSEHHRGADQGRRQGPAGRHRQLTGGRSVG